MKHIKIYESIRSSKTKPQIGDYVFVEPNTNRIWLSKKWRDYLKCHIGKIVRKYYSTYKIEFDTADGLSQILNFKIEEILDFSTNKKDLAYVENTKKFNI